MILTTFPLVLIKIFLLASCAEDATANKENVPKTPEDSTTQEPHCTVTTLIFAESVVDTQNLHPNQFGASHFPENVLGPPQGSPSAKLPNANPRHIRSLGFGYTWGFSTDSETYTPQEHQEEFAACLKIKGSRYSRSGCAFPDGYFLPHPKNRRSGTVILKLPVPVQNLPGPELFVYENPLLSNENGWYREYAQVSISPDGKQWFAFPCLPAEQITETCAGNLPTLSTAEHFGGDAFDIAEAPFEFFQFVRIRDATPLSDIFSLALPKTRGFDLDAIAGKIQEANTCP